MNEKVFLLFLALLAEKSSEHPLGKAIVNKIQALIPSETLNTFSHTFKVKEFKNKDGEGIVATISDSTNQSDLTISCGNENLMKSQGTSFEGVRSFFN